MSPYSVGCGLMDTGGMVWLGTGTAAQEWWDHHPWRCSRTVGMWHGGSVGTVGCVGVGMAALTEFFMILGVFFSF